MRPAFFLPLLFSLGCTGPTASDDVQTDAPPAAAAPARVVQPPHVESFHFDAPEVGAVAEGAGCGYSFAGNKSTDSSVFASSSDAIMHINGAFETLKDSGVYEESDSGSTVFYENSRFRVRVITVMDEGFEGGVSAHGKLVVRDVATGDSTTVAIEGGCGC